MAALHATPGLLGRSQPILVAEEYRHADKALGDLWLDELAGRVRSLPHALHHTSVHEIEVWVDAVDESAVLLGHRAFDTNADVLGHAATPSVHGRGLRAEAGLLGHLLCLCSHVPAWVYQCWGSVLRYHSGLHAGARLEPHPDGHGCARASARGVRAPHRGPLHPGDLGQGVGTLCGGHGAEPQHRFGLPVPRLPFGICRDAARSVAGLLCAVPQRPHGHCSQIQAAGIEPQHVRHSPPRPSGEAGGRSG
mmetsp:Transcript_117958/g.328688  ORF Transcript_117958/g.328688 Transcript_117958/m.328688 type:complete len:250 (-) Transcript_117958:118-867(-)